MTPHHAGRKHAHEDEQQQKQRAGRKRRRADEQAAGGAGEHARRALPDQAEHPDPPASPPPLQRRSAPRLGCSKCRWSKGGCRTCRETAGVASPRAGARRQVCAWACDP